MKLSTFVKETIKVGGTVAKVSVELGADVVGIIAEKIDNNPEDREKYVSGGKEIGKKIKESTNKAADNSVEVVDDLVEIGKEAINDIGKKVKEKSAKYSKDKNNTGSQNQSSKDDKTKDKPSNFTKRNGRTYITIDTMVENDQ